MKTSDLSVQEAHERIGSELRRSLPPEILHGLLPSIQSAYNSIVRYYFWYYAFNTIESLGLSPEHQAQYLDALYFSDNTSSVTIAFDSDDFLITGLENGVEPFSRHQKLLEKISNSTKISKKGFRYKIIPMESKTVQGSVSSKAEIEMHDARLAADGTIDAIAVKIAGQVVNLSVGSNTRGYITESVRLHSTQNKVRTQRIRFSAKRINSSGVELRFTHFRTISSNPESTRWKDHAGFPAVDIVNGFRNVYSLLQDDFFNETVNGIISGAKL